MKLNKLIKVANDHAEKMYVIALDKLHRDQKAFAKRNKLVKEG